jgi:hypothetical protein
VVWLGLTVVVPLGETPLPSRVAEVAFVDVQLNVVL